MFRAWRSVSRPVQILRRYHSGDHPASNLIIDPSRIENKILSKSLEYIPKYGFHQGCIDEAIRELGYSDSVQSVLTTSFNGNSLELQLMIHWLKAQRQRLQDEAPVDSELEAIGDEYERASYLINKRLSYNEPIISQLLGGLAQLMVPYNMPVAVEKLANLGDDLAFHAGDASIDFSWYAKRMSLAAVYVSSEMYMLQDKSAGFEHTKRFVEDKVKNIDHLAETYENVEQWLFFNAVAGFNLVKSQLTRG